MDSGQERHQPVKVSSLIKFLTIQFKLLNIRAEIQCPVLIAPANGKVSVGGRHPEDRADYSCNDGFKLKGVGWRKCQDNGHWTREAPTCESKFVIINQFYH